MSSTITALTSGGGLAMAGDTSGQLELKTNNGTTAVTINTSQGVSVLKCLGVGNATPSTSGAGITFPSTASASSDANTLDDYEEGTWTPDLSAGSAPTVTYVGRSGSYTKIGNMVTVFGSFSVSTISGGSGNARINNLPFPSANTNSGGAIGYFSVITLGSGYTQLGLYFSAASTSMFLTRSGTGLSADETPIANVPNGSAINFSCTYQTS